MIGDQLTKLVPISSPAVWPEW